MFCSKESFFEIQNISACFGAACVKNDLQRGEQPRLMFNALTNTIRWFLLEIFCGCDAGIGNEVQADGGQQNYAQVIKNSCSSCDCG
jgi:hypothetical protein